MVAVDVRILDEAEWEEDEVSFCCGCYACLLCLCAENLGNA